MNVDEARSDDVSGRVDDLIVCGRPDLPDLDDLVALDPNIIAERGPLPSMMVALISTKDLTCAAANNGQSTSKMVERRI